MEADVLVTAGTGANGSAVLPLLAGKGKRVYATTRRSETIEVDGVTTIELDWKDPEKVEFPTGIEQLYLIIPETIRDISKAAAVFLERAQNAGVRHTVLLSCMGVDRNESLQLRKIEHSVMDIMPHWTILRPNWFMQNFRKGQYLVDITQHDEIVVPAGEGKVSLVDVLDVASVAADALMGGNEQNIIYSLTGPAALGFDEVAAGLSEATGRTIKYVPLELDDPELVTKMGFPATMSPEPIRALFTGVRKGREAHVTNDIPDVLGRPATDFASYAHRNASTWSSARA